MIPRLQTPLLITAGAFQRINKVDALPSKACKQSFNGCINLL